MNTTFIKNPSHYLSLAKKLLCASAILLSSTVDSKAQLLPAPWVKITGTGTVSTGSNSVSSYPTPFGNKNAGQRAQYLYTRDDLIAAGLKPGWIDSLAFYVTNTNGAANHANLKFYVGSATRTTAPADTGIAGTLSGGWDAGLPLRYFDPIIATVAVSGWNKFGFSSPYYWNGTDNIVVGTCFWSGIDYRNASVEYTNFALSSKSGQNLSRTFVAAATTSTGIAVCNTTSGPSAVDNPKLRPNISFNNSKDTCASKPNAGAATVAFAAVGAVDFCILDDSLELGLKGVSLAYGLSFQWLSSTSPTGPWSLYGGTTTTSINRKGYQTTSTYYRCIVTCVAKGLKDTSVAVYVPQAPPFRCDCSSGSLDGSKEKILNVTLSTLFNATPCTPLPTTYLDFTGTIPPADLEPGTDYNLSVRLGSCDTFNRARAVKVFIDFNKNTLYEVSEMVYANTYSALQKNPQIAAGTFTVPPLASKGLTTMRIVYGQATALSDISPCGNYVAGETQDYAVNILGFGKPTVSGRLKVCQYDSVVMNAFSTADTPVVFSWTGPGGFTGVGPKITFVSADPSLTGTYYVTATSGGRTSSPLAVNVVVYPKPPMPNVLNANMCQYEPDGTLKTDGKNVLWYNVPVGGYGDTIAPKLPTYTPNTATFYLTQTVNGCVSDRAKVVININLKPAPPVVKSPVTYCQLQDADLVAKGTDLKWYLDSVGGVASTISPIPPTGFPDSIYYYVSQTINGCESDRARIKVIVYEQPNGIVLHSKLSVCQYDTASFWYFGNAPLSYQYKWFTTDATYLSGGGQGNVVYRFNDYGDKVINLYVNNGKCATSKISDTITVRPAPVGNIDTVLNACINVPVTISMDTATPNIEKYVWNWDGGYLANETENGGPYGVVWNTPGTKNLSLVVYHLTCPSLPITETVLVHDRPYAKILNISKVTNYGKDTTLLSGKICSRDTLVFTAYKDSTYRYKWYPEYYFDIDTNHIAADRMRNPAYIRVDVVSEFGCKSSDSTFVNAESCCEMSFPNAFTPNGDGKNDIFRPIRDGRQDIVIFRIANRWGQTVFETASTDTEGWDGTFAGRDQDMAVYQYYIKYKCLDGIYYEKKGDVTLIR